MILRVCVHVYVYVCVCVGSLLIVSRADLNPTVEHSGFQAGGRGGGVNTSVWHYKLCTWITVHVFCWLHHYCLVKVGVANQKWVWLAKFWPWKPLTPFPGSTPNMIVSLFSRTQLEVIQ